MLITFNRVSFSFHFQFDIVMNYQKESFTLNSLGPQFCSNRVTAPKFGFGTGTRAGAEVGIFFFFKNSVF